MTASSILPAPNLMPLMRYRDLAAAMSWLDQAFGFEKQIAVSDSDGEVIYGQMTYRGSLMMMGAVRDTDLDKLMRQPDEVGGIETQSCYIVVDDADEHYARSLEAGAEVVLDIKSDGLGRRGYSCRDPQGHIWNFGTYNPGRGLATAVTVVASQSPPAPARRDRAALFSIGSLILALGATLFWFSAEIKSDLVRRVADAAGQHAREETERAYAELVKVRAEKRKSEEQAQALNADLAAERARRTSVEANVGKTSKQFAEEQTARRSAEATIAALQDDLKREREAALEEKRASEEKLATASAPVSSPAKGATETEQSASQDAPAAAPVATQPSGGVSDIETSAMSPSAGKPTLPAVMAIPGADVDTSEAAKQNDASSADAKPADARPQKSSPKSQKPSLAKSKRSPAAYTVKLHDVQWPYNTW